MRPVLVVLACVLAAVPSVAAQVRVWESRGVFEDLSTLMNWSNATLHGAVAGQLRAEADDDGDGNITVDETATLEEELRAFTEQSERSAATVSLDARAPTSFDILDWRMEQIVGPTNATAPIRILAQSRYAFDPGPGRAHNFSEEGRVETGDVPGSVQVPPGFEITHVAGITNANVSEDRRTVAGTQKAGANLTILFERVGDDSPGPALGAVVTLVVGVACAWRRRHPSSPILS